MLEKSRPLEGNKQIRTTKRTSKQPKMKQLGEFYQDRNMSTANRTTLRENIKAKLSELGLTPDEIESYLEKEEKMWLFCTLFPQDYEFEKDILIQLWIAGGFLDGAHSHKNHIGDLYFQSLLSNEYINVTWSSDKDRYRVNSYKVNEDADKIMLHKELYATLKNIEDYNYASKEVQYAAALLGDEICLRRLKDFKNLEALMLINEGFSGINSIPLSVFLALKNLKVLDLSRTDITELPNSIGELIELRYLDVSYTGIELLPETLDNLLNLQTLKLNECKDLLKLPERMRLLTSLIHLELDILRQLDSMPKGIGALTKLETLSAFLVHYDKDRSITELKNMNNLTGSLCISRLENVGDSLKAKESRLFQKNLKEVELRWSEFHQYDEKQEEILQELLPNDSLEQLKISCYGGKKFPSWISDPSLNMLTCVTLFKCRKSVTLPSLGKLPTLKILSLVELDSVVEIGAAFRGDDIVAFPMLERLEIVGLVRLVRWENVKGGDYPCLNKLTIEKCPELVAIPSSILQLKNLGHLELIKCKALSTLLENTVSTLVVEECPLLGRVP